MPFFRCTHCQYKIDRPAKPYRCPNCRAEGRNVFVLDAEPRSATQAVDQPRHEPSWYLRPSETIERSVAPEPVPCVATEAQSQPSLSAKEPAPDADKAGEKATKIPDQPREPTAILPDTVQPAHPPTVEQPASTPVAPTDDAIEAAHDQTAAVRTRSKRLLWCYPESPPCGLSAPMLPAPAVAADGRLFFQIGEVLVALEQRGGAPQLCWEYPTGRRAPGPVVIARDGTLRLHTSDGLLHAIGPNGVPVWSPVCVGQPLPRSVPLVDEAGNTWICRYAGGLLRVDSRGKCDPGKPFFRSRAVLDSGGVIHHNVLYIGSHSSSIFAIDLRSSCGRNLWDHAAGSGETGWVVRCWLAMRGESTLVAAGADQCLYGFDLEGQLMWKTEMPGQMLGSPVLDAHGHVYVGTSQALRGRPARGMLVCVDAWSHQVRWLFEAADAVESTPVIGDDGHVYFGDNAGNVYAVDTRGRLQWKVNVGSPVRSAGTIIGPNCLAFGTDSHQLMVLECSSSGLAEGGWPKIGKTLAQCGLA